MLHKFESFLPKNLANRQEHVKQVLNDLFKKHEPAVEKETAKLKRITAELQKKVDALKNVRAKDEAEQFVIDYLKDNFSTVSYEINVDLSDDNIELDVNFLNRDSKLYAQCLQGEDEFFFIYFDKKKQLGERFNLKPSEIKRLISKVLKEHLNVNNDVTFFDKDDLFFSEKEDLSKPHINLYHDDFDLTIRHDIE